MTLHASPTGRAFRIDDCRVNWEPEVVELSADDLRIIASDDDQTSDPRREAKEWLIQQLEPKRALASEIKRRAADDYIPWRLLWAAKKACQVTSFKDPKDHRYYWKLPDNWMRDYTSDLIPVVI
jgi:hypothetical protein